MSDGFATIKPFYYNLDSCIGLCNETVMRIFLLLLLLTPLYSQNANQSETAQNITIVLTGQSMIRSDIRSTGPAAVPVIQALLKGDVVFTNLECTIAETGETIHEDRGFLTPPEALDALTTFGFNLLSLANNHAVALKVTGIQNTLRETSRRKVGSCRNRE